MSDLAELEAEVEASRSQLQGTIAAIQDKLTLSGLVDELVGQERARTAAARLTGEESFVGSLMRRHPVPVMIAAAGIGFLIHRMGRRGERERAAPRPAERPALNPDRNHEGTSS